MAHNDEFSRVDNNWTVLFLNEYADEILGPRVLDLCGGMSRCSSWYGPLFDTVDVLDLQPEWGELVEKK